MSSILFFIRLFSKRLPMALLLSIFLLGPPLFASAHPLGNFSVNRYSRLEVASQQIGLFYVLDMAEIPTFQERSRIDLDEDQTISASEQELYLASLVKKVGGELHLIVNGIPQGLQLKEQKLTFPIGQGGLQTMRLEVHFIAPLSPSQEGWHIVYRDETYKGRLGWQEIVLDYSNQIEIRESSVPTEDISQALQLYPDELLQSPLAVSEASIHFELSAGAKKGTVSQSLLPVREAKADKFAQLITLFSPSSGEAVGLGTFVLALLAAFGFGAAHALTPGHGKTIVAAYLVGSRGTIAHAIFLGLTTTITHTAGVFALGLMTLFLSQYILPEQLYPWLALLSGLLVVGIGGSMVVQHLLVVRASALPHSDHHSHSHPHPHPHHHHHDDHHHLPLGADGARWRSLLALGISGGLLPCPSALIVLLSAIALQRVGIGLLLIVAFSLGLATVLTGIGILMVYANRLFKRLPVQGRLIQLLPVGSALLITIVGIVLTLQALAQTGLLDASRLQT